MVKEKLNGEFEIKDLGLIKRVFGIDVIRNRDKSELFLSKTSYLKKVVEYFRMSNSKGWHPRVITQSCPLNNVLNPSNDNGGYSLYKLGWKHHVWT